MYGEVQRSSPLLIGAHTSAVGHMPGVNGLLGVIKVCQISLCLKHKIDSLVQFYEVDPFLVNLQTLMSLHYRELPPHPFLKNVHPSLGPMPSNVAYTPHKAWVPASGYSKGAVHSIGLGGVAAHCLVAQEKWSSTAVELVNLQSFYDHVNTS